MARLHQIMQFLEHNSIDEKLYLKLACRKNPRHTVEIIWDKAGGAKPWQLRPAHHVQWQHFRPQDLRAQLLAEDLDIASFEEELKRVVVTQAIFADYYSREAQKLFGDETLAEAKQKSESLLADLSSLVHKLKSRKERIAPMSTTFKSKRSIQHLRLIDEKS